jgi:hypothetical protein
MEINGSEVGNWSSSGIYSYYTTLAQAQEAGVIFPYLLPEVEVLPIVGAGGSRVGYLTNPSSFARAIKVRNEVLYAHYRLWEMTPDYLKDDKFTWEDMLYGKYNSSTYNRYEFSNKELVKGGDALFAMTLMAAGGLEYGLVRIASFHAGRFLASFSADAAAQMTLASGTFNERFLQWNFVGSLASGLFQYPMGQAFVGSAFEIKIQDIKSGNYFQSSIFGDKNIATLGIQTAFGSIFNFSGSKYLEGGVITKPGVVSSFTINAWYHAPLLYGNYFMGNVFSNSVVNTINH